MSMPPADWYPDPVGRHQLRYWDGQRWTEHVADHGDASVDPLPGATTTTETDAAQADRTGAAQADGTGAAPAGETIAAGSASVQTEATGAEDAPDASPAAAGRETGVATGSASPARSTVAAAAGTLRGDLLLGGHRPATGPRVRRQNPTMLAVSVEQDVLVRPGSVVATTGEVRVAPAESSEPTLWRCRGAGEVFVAQDGGEVHVLWLEGAGLVVDPGHLLAVDASLQRSAAHGSRTGVALQGDGWVAVLTRGTPVVLDVSPGTRVAAGAVVAWSPTATMREEPMLDGGGGADALALSGDGVVVVEAHPAS